MRKKWRISLTVRTTLNKEGRSLTLFDSNIKARRYCLERTYKQGVFEAILDNLTDQGTLAGFGAYVFTMHVIQQKQENRGRR
jgi:hypothetical protein